MEDKKKITGLIKGIKSDNEETVLSTIKEIRKEGNTTTLPELINLLHTTNNEEIKISVTKLLNDLKDNKAAPLIIDAINNKEYKNINHTLISSCWQSGLDYRNYLNVFVDLAIKSDYNTALEAFTVIENLQKDIDEEEILKAINNIKENIVAGKNQEKQILLNELIKVIRNLNLNEEYI